MSERIPWLLLVCAGFCFSASDARAQAGPSAQGPCVVEKSERDVYATVISEFIAGTSAAFIDEDTDKSHFATEFNLEKLALQDQVDFLYPRLLAAPKGSVLFLPRITPEMFSIPTKARAEMSADYEAKLSQSCKIGGALLRAKNVRIARRAEMNAIFDRSDPHTEWEKFHKRYGEWTTIHTLSRVAFDRTQTFAMLCVNYYFNQGAAGGKILFLKHERQGWVIKRIYPTWTT
jgi:hypothetical protein